ncbi:MAG TPA: sugar ABC transporter permease [Treponema sp.]|nr:MAG: sugar ABC transporter permease [Treponema sp. GWC1_61_84]OHE72002.1 MAG: sugar ABC transporter permease [Treponema sp. RIFOXYC1_FULL_61_9]HCM27629.1 sugar ABC transporter permease [Treponema sp.]
MKHAGRTRGKALFFWCIFAPALAVMLWLTIYPMLTVFATSFQNYNYISGSRSWTGLGNYSDILGDKLFQASFSNTLIYCLAATAVEVLLGIVLALVFYGHFRGKGLFMILAILPMMLSTMVVSSVWKTLYHYDIGLLNNILAALGFARAGWLIDPEVALWSLVLVDVWQWTPFAFIVVQAGLASVPQEIFEASVVDGANYRQTLFRITLPILRDQILLLCLLRTIDTFKVFAKVFALTKGGPGNATETTSYFIYREAFQYFKLGRSSAASMITLVAVAFASAIYLRKILSSKEA